MDKSELDAAPKITLGRKEWPVPELSARQNRIIDPLILGLLPIFSEWQSNKTTALGKIGAAEYESLLDIALTAIRRGSPDISKEAFLDLPITLPELINAFPIIANQTGLFKKDTSDAAPGEAQGAGSSQTGIA